VYHTLNWFEKMIVDVYHTIYYWVYLLNNNVLHIGSIVQGGNFIVRTWAWNKMAPANPEYNFYGEDSDICRRLYKLGGVKFNQKLIINASGRRLKEEGLVKTGGLYVINYFSVLFFKKPATKKYSDVRAA
jgi:GT2 family glycosyltransferase